MKKKTFVRIVCLCLCLAMLIGSVMPMLAVGIVITEEGTYLDEKPSVVKINGRVADVEALIDAIGTVAYSDDSLAKIVAAEKAYGKLTDELKYQVKNSGLLKSLRNAYDALAADHVDTSALTPVDSGSIGEVKWTVYESGLLEFSGSGSIPSYSHGESPWYGYRDSVTSILVRSSVWTIGGEAFYGCNNVTNVTLPFVGESRTATGIAGQFGYIFGYKRSSSSCSSSEFDNGSSSSSFAPGYGYYHSDNYGSSSYYYYTFNTPSKINTVTITDATRLAKAAFHNCGYITKIVLNDGITSVGDYAFYDSAIKDFAIPNSVTSIGKYSFCRCDGLTEMSIPNGVTDIPKYAFSGCSNIVKLTLSRNTKSIGDYAFCNCSKVNKLVIPDKTETIGSYAFSDCSSIPEINIPDSVTSIGTYAFSGNRKATKLNIGSRLKTIPSYAFQNCTGLTSIVVPDTVTTIQEFAFYGCANVTNVTLPFVGESRTATGIAGQFGYIFGYVHTEKCSYSLFDNGSSSGSFAPGYGYYYSVYPQSNNYYYYYTFNTPSKINTVTITDATRLAKAAFHNCSYITKIVLNDGITSVGDYAFYSNPWYTGLTDEFVIDGDNVLIKYNGTKSGVIIPENVKAIAGGVFRYKTTISEVTLPDGLLRIEDNVFSGCSNLTALTIPKSVVSIGSNAIPSTCTISVYQPSAGYNYRSSNRIVLNNSYTTGNETYYYIVNDDGCAEIIGCKTTSTELTVPTDIDGIVVNKIGDYGFANCTTLNSITIPKNILNIGKYAFSGCTGIVNATIPTTVNTVGDYAFNNCTGLKYVTISEGVQALGEGAFYNCTSLTEAVVPDTAAYVGSYAFYNCISMTTATIGTTAASIGDYTFYNCKSLENVVIGLSVESIGDYAFYGCALGRVTIPSATTSIGRYAFADNTKMTRATLRKNLLTIGDGAFRNDGLLATISIPTTVTYIGVEAFENCSSIPSAIIPAGVTEINDRAFSNCSSLASVTINGNVTRIGVSAFYNNAFESITLPETVIVLDDSAFRDCINLKEINIPTAVEKIGDAAFLECYALENVSMPDSVATVGDSVFFFNNDLTITVRKNSSTVAESMLEMQGMNHVVLDPEISAIGNNAFASCYELKTITYGEEPVNDGEYKFSSALKTVGSEAFKDNPLLRNFIVPDTIESIGTNAFYNAVQSGYHCKDVTVTFYYVNGVIAANILDSQYVWHIVVNDNIHTLSDKAFYNCPVLETISIPDTVSSVGANVFANPGKNVTATFRGVDGTIDASVYNGKTKGLKYIAVDENVDTIGDYAFANTDTVVGVVITNTETIGDYAFNTGTVMNYVEIGKANIIGKYAFSDSNTKRIELDNINTIDDYAFSNCITMQNVYIDSVVNINDYAFFNDLAINNIVINENLVHIGEHAFDSCKSIPKVVLPETVREIDAYAFYDCNSMVTINVPVGVTAINNYTFFGCASLLGIEIPDTVTKIGDYAYYGCVVAKTLDMSSTTKSIGAYAFYNCNQVKEINLPSTLQSIGNYAFRSCSSITEISVPDNVTDFGDCVFYACTGLEQAEFGVGITSIGNSEFYGCVKFEKLMLNGDVEYIHDLAFYGAEDAVIYSFKNQYVEDYCYDMGLEYCELSIDFTMVMTPPTKTDYYELDELDLTGLELNLHYANGLDRTVSTGYTVSGYDPTVLGKQTVTITYNGVSDTFDVTVNAKEISGITAQITGDDPVFSGEDLDVSRIAVTVLFADGTEMTVTEGFEATGFDKNVIGEQTVTVSFREKTGTLVVNALDPDHVFGEWQIVKASTHTEVGLKRRYCTNEGCSFTEETEIPKNPTHTGGTATCTEQAECSECHEKYGDLLPHTYDREVVDAMYLASAATCTKKATYYKSCVCGAAGNETFEAGEYAAPGQPTWTIDGHVLIIEGNGCAEENLADQTLWQEKADEIYRISVGSGINAVDVDLFSGLDDLTVIDVKGKDTLILGGDSLSRDVILCGVTASGTQRFASQNGYTFVLAMNCAHLLRSHIASIDPTEEEPGNSEYWACDSCKKYFSDGRCTHEIPKDSWIIPALTPVAAGEVIVSSVSGQPGKTVDVTVKMKDNPGVSAMTFVLTYGSGVTLESVTFNSSLGGQTGLSKTLASPAVIQWVNAFGVWNDDDVFATLTFRISDDAAYGTNAEISLSYDSENVYVSQGMTETNVPVTVTNGRITVLPLAGDINGDGVVNSKDITRLFQYQANWPVIVNEYALDVNGDGDLNSKDITRLFQYQANWDVEIYVSESPAPQTHTSSD